MLKYKKLNPIVTELFIRGIKLNNSLVFTKKSYFTVQKNLRLNSGHYFIMKIPSKQEFAFNHSSDIDFEDSANLYKKYIEKAYPFLVIDETLAADNILLFRRKLLERT